MIPYFSGFFVALVTPFNAQGEIDEPILRELVSWHIDQGTDGLVCFGSTGEGIALSDEEKIKIASICIDEAKGKIPILAASGFAETRHSVSFTQIMKDLGVDGSLIITPYYNRPSQRGCIAHFQAISEVKLPIIVYHHPFRTAFRFTLESIKELAQIPHIVGIKESSHDLPFIEAVRNTCPLPIFAGDDDVTIDILRLGGIGTISVIGNLIPKEWKKILTLCFQKKWDDAQTLFDTYAPFLKTLFLETNPQCVKYAMHLLGKCSPILRLPLVMPELQHQELIQLALRNTCKAALQTHLTHTIH